jgi:KDO2-lipid IV(A) lauroyltransferase
MKARHQLETLLVRTVRVLVRLLPMSVVRRLGHGMGRVAYLLDATRRRTTLENLGHAFPGRSLREQRQLARAVFSHFGGLLLELIKFGTWPPARMLAAVETEGEDRVRQALQEARGVLVFTGHFGYWEMLALALPLRIAPIAVLARPLDNRQLDAMLEGLRTRTGNTVIPRRGAVRRILRELGAGHIVGILIDQHLHEADAVQVAFFQRPAATTSALAAIALRTGAPVLPVFALPLPKGRYRLIYEHPVQPPLADTPDAVREFTQRCTDVLEMYVRRHPELWMWMHRRWRETGSGIGDPESEGTGNEEPGTRGSRTPDPGSRERADV